MVHICSNGDLGYNYSFDYNEYLMFVIKDLCLYKLNSVVPIVHNNSDQFIVVDYVNNLLDDINLTNIMKHNNIKDLFPHNGDSLAMPCISYRYSKTIRSKVCNYQSASALDYRDVVCACANYDNKYVNAHHGHIFTGDLGVINNQQLQSLLRKGLNFRESNKPDGYMVLNSIKSSLDAYIDMCSNKLGKSVQLFANWKSEIMEVVKNKLNKVNIYKYNAVLHHKDNIDCLIKLQQDFIFVPVDKASNNVAIICKHYYVKSLHDELSLSGHFTTINEDNANVVSRCAESIINSQVDVSNSQLKLPHAYWTPKMHKNPPGKRYITSCRNTVISNLSNVVGLCLSRLINTDKNISKYLHKFKNYNNFFIIDNRNDIIDYMKRSNALGHNSKSVKTYDFKTLYTSIPLDKLKDVLNIYIKKVFKDKGKRYIIVCGKSCYFSNRRDNNKITFTANGLIEQVNYIIENAYVEFNGQIYRQIVGIPMGTNCGPYLANIFLHHYEQNFIKRMVEGEQWDLLQKLAALFRYQDDCLIFEDNGEFGGVLVDIYPAEMEIENTNLSVNTSTYLDLYISVHRGKYSYRVFDKRKEFNFKVINYPFLPSNNPKYATYGVFTSQLIRLCQVNSNIHSLKKSFKELCSQFIKQGFNKSKLINRYDSFINKYANLWTMFGFDISSSKFKCDLFK